MEFNEIGRIAPSDSDLQLNVKININYYKERGIGVKGRAGRAPRTHVYELKTFT